MRVAHVVLGLNVGGLEQVVLRLVERLDRTRFEPLLLALEEPGALAGELERLGVQVHVLGRRGGFEPQLALRTAQWLRQNDVRIVHTHNPSPHLYGSVGAALAGAIAGALALFDAADAAGTPRPRVVHTKHGRNYPKEPRKVWVNRIASALTDRVVAVSDDARGVVTDIERVAPEKVVTILNGVDVDAFHCRADERTARARLGVYSEGFHVGCVARLSPEKDHASLLRAFAILRRDLPDAHLTLVGDGPCRAPLLALASELGLGASVTFAGMRDDIAAVLPAFDAFALASLTEGISLTLIEAAASCLPIVATRVGGNPEIVDHGETGLLVPPGDPEALARALADLAGRPDRAVFGERGRAKVVERFSLVKMARAYEALYEELLAPEA